MQSILKGTTLALIAAAAGATLVYATRGEADRHESLAMNPATQSAPEHDVANDKPLYTCGMHPQVIQDHPGTCPICHMKLTPLHRHGDEVASGVVQIDPAIVQNMGVRTAEVVRGALRVSVRAVGMLQAPEPGVSDVNLKVNGWIEKLYADTEGMHVTKGEPLFDLYSPDVQVAEEELMGATKALKALDVASPDMLRRESQGMVNSAKQKLRQWGIADQDIDAIAHATVAPASVPIRSPADGDLLEKSVFAGSAVQAGMKVMRIEDHSKLWLNVLVYEDQLSQLALGQQVTATTDGAPGRTFTGPITFIAPHVDHMTRTAMARIDIDNANHHLRPGQYATATIHIQPAKQTLLVPREAVIDTGVRQIAFVAEAEGRFTPRDVHMGLNGDDDLVQILEGLNAGEQVVTSGQFLMDVESRTNEAIDKLRHGPMSGMPMPMAAAPMAMATTAPSTSLAIAHCPMKNADWIQIGDAIANPYYGSAMADCGSVTKTIAAPAEGTPLDAVTDNYLLVAKALDTDTLDLPAIQALKSAAAGLDGKMNNGLRQAIDALAEAKAIKPARTAFTRVSAELIKALNLPAM